MIDVIIDKLNETYLKITTDEGIDKRLYEFFSFTNDKLRFQNIVEEKKSPLS